MCALCVWAGISHFFSVIRSFNLIARLIADYSLSLSLEFLENFRNQPKILHRCACVCVCDEYECIFRREKINNNTLCKLEKWSLISVCSHTIAKTRIKQSIPCNRINDRPYSVRWLLSMLFFAHFCPFTFTYRCFGLLFYSFLLTI